MMKYCAQIVHILKLTVNRSTIYLNRIGKILYISSKITPKPVGNMLHSSNRLKKAHNAIEEQGLIYTPHLT